MGSTVCRAVEDDPDLELVAAIDPLHGGIDLSRLASTRTDLQVMGNAEQLSNSGAQVAVDFTDATAARENLRLCAQQGIHAVVGTTGLDDGDIERLRGLFTQSNCVIAPNFAIGALLMMKLAADAARYFDTAEILEFHHDNKLDAPSGTALATAARMSANRDRPWAGDPTTNHVLEGARGGTTADGIGVHSIRMRGMVAHQEVILGTTGQTLSIRHDSYDRTSFMPGVVMAVKHIADHPGVTVGLEEILGL